MRLYVFVGLNAERAEEQDEKSDLRVKERQIHLDDLPLVFRVPGLMQTGGLGDRNISSDMERISAYSPSDASLCPGANTNVLFSLMRSCKLYDWNY